MQKIKKLIHIFLGIALVLLGVVGLVLPILNGIIFLLLGFILLSFESPYIEFHLSKLAHKNITIGSWYEKLLIFMKRLFGRT